MFKDEKGITLVALLITIIVLVILAGVSIITLQETGIINTAIESTQKYDNSQMAENSIVNNFDYRLSKVMSNLTNIQDVFSYSTSVQAWQDAEHDAGRS